MIRYRDFDTGQPHRTYGKPTGAQRGGPTGVWYLAVTRKASTLLIPEYCLDNDGRVLLERMKAERRKRKRRAQ